MRRRPIANMSFHRATVVVSLLFATLAAQAPKVTLTREIFPTDVHYFVGDERWLTARIVDGITGAPIPGAELLLIAESEHPMRGEFWWQMRAVADADGFVRLRCDAGAPGYKPWDWTVVRAAGYGPTTSMNVLEGVVLHLARAETMPVRIVDRDDRPVADALVGFCGGCGHTPDLVHARTDANGLAMLVGVDPHNDIGDLYVEHPALHLGYNDFDWFPGQAPVVFRVRPGVPSIGILVDAAGKPVADAYVGTREVHRGPWTRTAADGSFRLYGCAEPVDLEVYHGEQHAQFERPPLQPFRLQLPIPNGERTQFVNLPAAPPEPPDAVPVQLSIQDQKGHALPAAHYRCIGPLPARDTTAGSCGDDPAELSLRPGRYEVHAIGDDFADSSTVIVVGREGQNEFTLQPTPLPAVIVRAEGLPEDGEVWLNTATNQREITLAVREGRAIGVPDEPFSLVLRHGAAKHFEFDRARALAEAPLRLQWFPPTRVEGQVVDRDGEPTRARVALRPVGSYVSGFERDEDLPGLDTPGAFALTTEEQGLAFVVVRHLTHNHRPRIVPVMLPPRGEHAHVDVGTLVLDGPPRLLLRSADGEPLVDGKVELVRQGWNDVREGAPSFPVDAGGEWNGPDPRAGDAIVVRPAEPIVTAEPAQLVVDLDVRFPLSGDGPWTLQLPAGEVLLEVRSTTGEDIGSTVILGEQKVDLRARNLLRRLWPGPLRLFVAAEKHQSAIVEVVVPSTGRATVKVELPPR